MSKKVTPFSTAARINEVYEVGQPLRNAAGHFSIPPAADRVSVSAAGLQTIFAPHEGGLDLSEKGPWQRFLNPNLDWGPSVGIEVRTENEVK